MFAPVGFVAKGRESPQLGHPGRETWNPFHLRLPDLSRKSGLGCFAWILHKTLAEMNHKCLELYHEYAAVGLAPENTVISGCICPKGGA